LDKAINCYDKAIELVPYHEAWNNKGFVYYLKKEYDNALFCFNRHLINNPDDILGYVNQSTVLIALRQFSDGLESCSKGLGKESMNADLWNNKGICYHDLNLTQEALECYDKALQIDSNHFKSWDSKGFTYYTLNRIEEALDYYDKAIEINPNYAVAWFHKGLLLEDSDITYSINCYYEAIRINPNYADAWFNLGSINLHAVKDFGKAIKCFQNTLRFCPKSYDTLFSLPEVYSSYDSYTAIQYYDKAVAIKEDFSLA
jgi:tetratricopeptide (TPR) repeat protein